MNKPKAVIFDLDGTLLNTLTDIAGSANAVLRDHGFDDYSEKFYKNFVGNGVRVLMQRCSGLDDSDPQVDALVEDFREHYNKNWNNRTQPYDGIPALLDKLKNHGLPLAILSNKPHDFSQHCVEHYFPARFSRVHGLIEGRPAKPDPSAALEMAGEWGLKPEEIAFVGDTSVDMQTAVNAGMHPIGVLWGFRSRKELEKAGAAVIVKDSRELEHLLL